jgi:two-component system, OmpR family, response regulator
MNSIERRVLLIEDDQNLAHAVELLLRDQGFAVDQEHDGESGLQAALNGSYDVIVLDLMLPKRNGFSVCDDLRKAGNYTPLLMLTAKDGDLDEIESFEVGADQFLRKPFENAVLVARVQSLLRRHERAKPKNLVTGHVSVDPLSRKVMSGEHVVTLTPREFALLSFLMTNTTNPLSKEQILHEVWGSDFDGDPNIVEVYIGYLRKKLDLADRPSIIKTVRGVGYAMSRD